jgi:hypothetical protein
MKMGMRDHQRVDGGAGLDRGVQSGLHQAKCCALDASREGEGRFVDCALVPLSDGGMGWQGSFASPRPLFARRPLQARSLGRQHPCSRTPFARASGTAAWNLGRLGTFALCFRVEWSLGTQHLASALMRIFGFAGCKSSTRLSASASKILHCARWRKKVRRFTNRGSFDQIGGMPGLFMVSHAVSENVMWGTARLRHSMPCGPPSGSKTTLLMQGHDIAEGRRRCHFQPFVAVWNVQRTNAPGYARHGRRHRETADFSRARHTLAAGTTIPPFRHIFPGHSVLLCDRCVWRTSVDIDCDTCRAAKTSLNHGHTDSESS